MNLVPQIVVRGAWTQADGWCRNLRFPTNPANTSAIMHAQRLLVCCEGGPPIEVDLITLHTRGEHLFGEGLPMGFSAHAKIDEADGCLCAFPSFAPLPDLKS